MRFSFCLSLLLLVSLTSSSNSAVTGGWSYEESSNFTILVLRLRILKSDGEPLRNGKLTATYSVDTKYKGYDGGTSDLVTDENGLGTLPTGRWVKPGPTPTWLYLRAKGEGAAQTNFIAGEDVHEVKLQKSGATLRIEIAENQTERPLGGATISINYIMTELPPAIDVDGQLSYMPWIHTSMYGLQTRDGDGSIELMDVVPGRYILRPFVLGCDSPALAVDVAANERKVIRFVLSHIYDSSILVKIQDAQGHAMDNRDFALEVRSAHPDSMEYHRAVSFESATQQELEMVAFKNVAGRGRNSRRLFHTNDQGLCRIYPVYAGDWRLELFNSAERLPEDKPLAPLSTVKLESGKEATVTFVLEK